MSTAAEAREDRENPGLNVVRAVECAAEKSCVCVCVCVCVCERERESERERERERARESVCVLY